MGTTEYIEYCEDEVKMEIKSEDDYMELSQNRKYSEYFEEDVKEEIVDEKNPPSNLVKHVCDICILIKRNTLIIKLSELQRNDWLTNTCHLRYNRALRRHDTVGTLNSPKISSHRDLFRKSPSLFPDLSLCHKKFNIWLL